MLFRSAAAECDLTTAEGRARMLAQARPLWLALPEGALRSQLLGELARAGGLPVDELSRLWHEAGGRQRSAPPAGSGASSAEAPPERPAFRRGGRWGRDTASSSPRNFGGRRQPPKRPEDRVLQMLFGQPAWWLDLPPHEQDLLHALPAPHGPLVAWLERDLAEHGPRAWAVLREVLAEDPGFDDTSRAIADGDADPGATPEDLRRALDVLVERELAREMQTLLAEAAQHPDLLSRYRELDRQWREVKRRLSQAATSS